MSVIVWFGGRFKNASRSASFLALSGKLAFVDGSSSNFSSSSRIEWPIFFDFFFLLYLKSFTSDEELLTSVEMMCEPPNRKISPVTSCACIFATSTYGSCNVGESPSSELELDYRSSSSLSLGSSPHTYYFAKSRFT